LQIQSSRESNVRDVSWEATRECAARHCLDTLSSDARQLPCCWEMEEIVWMGLSRNGLEKIARPAGMENYSIHGEREGVREKPE